MSRKRAKGYTLATLTQAVAEYHAGQAIRTVCLICGQLLVVKHPADTTLWVIQCPQKHFVYRSSNLYGD